MGRSRTLCAVVATLAGFSLAACDAAADDPTASAPRSEAVPSASVPDEQPTASSAPDPYDSRNFTPPLTVDRPAWLPAQPVLDELHFLTWVGEGVDVDRAVRFLSPIGIYAPSAPDKQVGKLHWVPDDYVRYLLGLREHGAQISDRTTLEVDGRHATLMTAGTSASLSGTLGCWDEGQTPGDCMGLQPYALIRLAVIDDDGTTVLAWARTLPGSPTRDQDFAAFEAMLATLRFR
jgi:hypothetical protein